MNAIEIAIKMEKDAINFYKESAERIKSPMGKRMFLAITEDEKRHLEMLSQLFKGLNITVKDVSPIQNIKTIFEEMKEEVLERIEVTEDELGAFKIAMQMEKEGAEFYKKRASEARTEKEKLLFDKLVQEEEEHYKIFSNTYSFLSDTGNWFMWEERGIVDGGTTWA